MRPAQRAACALLAAALAGQRAAAAAAAEPNTTAAPQNGTVGPAALPTAAPTAAPTGGGSAPPRLESVRFLLYADVGCTKLGLVLNASGFATGGCVPWKVAVPPPAPAPGLLEQWGAALCDREAGTVMIDFGFDTEAACSAAVPQPARPAERAAPKDWRSSFNTSKVPRTPLGACVQLPLWVNPSAGVVDPHSLVLLAGCQ
eukprot:TRINITY_DN70053_c0_g1_i1.p2 TRINITY_DN70053_c0_g1~~TRINITY_DN70053_c0_g1_i1.p2  ORF type:complete len:201 (+),score=49.59 TRINITY_DN70053_c0_g1_i1:76-678(+)